MTPEQVKYTQPTDPRQAVHDAFVKLVEIVYAKVEENAMLRARLARTEEVLATHFRDGV